MVNLRLSLSCDISYKFSSIFARFSTRRGLLSSRQATQHRFLLRFTKIEPILHRHTPETCPGRRSEFGLLECSAPKFTSEAAMQTQTDVLFLRSSSFDNLPDVVDADWLACLTAGEALLHGPGDVATLFWGGSRLVDTLFGGKDGIQNADFICFVYNFNFIYRLIIFKK